MSRFNKDRSEVSSVIKYLVFGFNVIFWIIGGLMLAVGLWAWAEKDMFTNLSKLSQIPLDPALLLILSGSLIYIIGFTGCIGALRENTNLLLIYCVSVGIIFFCEMAIGIIIFVYKDWVKDQVKLQLKTMIVQYRDDPDLQNLIDWVQEEWLKCCGVEGFSDWDQNIYFNCSSPSREACGVPFSCCKPNLNEAIKNWQCGYDARKRRDASDLIYTVGCIDQGEVWVNHNLIPVAAVFVGMALVQILGICFAQNLRSDIFAQKARWRET